MPDDSCDINGILKQSGKQTTLKQWCDFFAEFQTTMEKHLSHWHSKEFLPMVIGSSDHDVSRILENWLMKNDPGPLQGDNKCWFDFLKATDIDVTEMVSRDYILKNNWEAISKLASGNHLLWGNNRSNNGNIARLRKMICEYVLAQKHHQQSGEAVVRDMGICTQTRQDEISGSSLTTFVLL